MKPHLTRDTQQFVDDLAAQNAPPLYTLSYEEARQVLIGAQKSAIEKPDCVIQDFNLPIGPTGDVSMRIVKPARMADEKLPVIFYLHGGGWVMGNKETHDYLVRKLAKGARAAVVFPEYINAPDARYPIQIEQCYAALEYIARHARDYNLDDTRIAVAGDSVGGNMAAVMALMCKERKGPAIIFQALLYPVTDYAFDTASYHDFAEGPWLTREAMKWFWNAYLPDTTKAGEPYVSPLRAPLSLLENLPPALVLTVENDVLRDEGEAYARKLDEAGVPVACMRVNGTQHDFMMLHALAKTAPAKTAVFFAAKALRKALRKRDCSMP